MIERNYRGQSLSAAIEDFAMHRQTTLRILTVSPEQLRRSVTLGNTCLVSIRQLIEIVAAHDKTHPREIESLLEELCSNEFETQDVAALRETAHEFAEGFNSGDLVA